MKHLILIGTLMASFGGLNGQENKYHSFHPGDVWMDNTGTPINAHGGGIFYEQGTYYWFGEHKIEGSAGNVAQVGVHCYSSTDLYNWKDEGIVLPVAPENSDSDIAKGCILERPKVIYNASTKKYVMWFHLETKGVGYTSARSGIAVSDKVTGPYAFIRSERPDKGFWPKNVLPVHSSGKRPPQGQKYPGGSLPAHPDTLNLLGRDFEGGQMARDMTVFVDDDGVAYHVYSSEENSTLHISRLSDDYLSHSGEYIRVFVHRFMEAPALFKRNGKYYLIASGCTGWYPNEARSAVAESIWGPWTELGNPCKGEDAELTFHTQSTFVIPIQGKKDAFIFMADRWNPRNAIDGRYVWLPVEFENETPVIRWRDEWKHN